MENLARNNYSSINNINEFKKCHKGYINNVVGFKSNTIQKTINVYFGNKAKRSKCTATSYKSHIQEFTMFFFNKQIDELTWEDLESEELDADSLIAFQLYLADKNCDNTVNTKFEAITSFIRFLSGRNSKLNNLYSIIRNTERYKITKNHRGAFTEEEISQLLEFCKRQEKRNLIKYLYFKTLYVSAIRREAVRNMRWENIVQDVDETNGKLIWTIKVIDKGGVIKPASISDEFYQELCQLKNHMTQPNYKVFKIGDKMIDDTLEAFCNEYGINKKGRNISIHSVKHSSINTAWALSNHDLKVTQIHGKHGDIQTTADNYISEVPLSKQISYIIDKKIDTSIIDNMSKEELAEVIKSCGTDVIVQIISKSIEKGYGKKNE